MTIALWCVLVGALLPIACAGLAKYGATDFDNGAPREWFEKQEGWRKRADAAQRNGWEAFPLFAVAVLVATTQGAGGAAVNALALAWVGLRLAYVWAYVADRPSLRSPIFALALLVAVAIFTAPLWG
ncbi:MAPEG family protein [Methylopila sp. M107]|uniref:MAPEG family protein n=1 Tax=Methylopila sp. M107 TaxID=1101190 RepID=UPI0003789D87|nr:MAPEG family protein [Methylopila sp. M107]